MVIRGQLPETWWSQKDLDSLPYINEPFNDPDSLALWKALGYTQTRFTGDLYDMRNPEPNWITPLRDYFKYDYFSWAMYRMPPGTTLPNHSDTYKKFVEINNISDPTKIVRTIVFMKDWESGHYFEINDCPITQWHRGEFVTWKYDTPHLAANVGMTHRYTLQITGVVND